MKKPLLLILAAALFIFYCYGFYRWLQSGHTFTDVWQAATSDWFLAITLLDTCLFALLSIIWLARDMSRRKHSTLQIILMVIACIISGVVPLLIYLAFRQPKHKHIETLRVS